MDAFTNCIIDVSSVVSVVDHNSFFQSQWDQHWEEVAGGYNTDLAFVSNAGVVTSAHQAVVLPLSPLLSGFLASSQCCGCPQHLPTLILPDWDVHVVRALLQLLYTGRVSVIPRQNLELMELIEHLGLKIDRDRLSEEWMHQRPEEDEEWVGQTPGVENVQQLGSDSWADQHGDELASYPVSGQVVDSQMNHLDGETSEQADSKFDCFREETVGVQNSSNEKEPNDSQTFTCVNCNKTFSEEKVMTYMLHERNCKERSQSEPSHSSCPFQDYQISVPNFYGRSLRDRESVYQFVDNEENNLNGDISMDLDGIVKKEANESDEEERAWKNVDVCIICYHNLHSLDLADRGAHFYIHFKRQLVSWLDCMLQVYFCDPRTCPQCDAKFSSKKALCKHMGSVHNLYQTFLNRYIDGDHDLMPKEAFPSRQKSTFKPKNSRKIGTATSNTKSTRKTLPDVNGNIRKQLNKKGGKIKQLKQITDKYKKQGLQNNDDESNLVNKGGAKDVGNEDIKSKKDDNKLKTRIRKVSKEVAAPEMKTLVKDVACELCNKTYATGGLLLQHACGHFKKELKQGYPDIFSSKSGEKVACPKCNKGPMKKSVLLIHIGATHKEVTKFAPWAKTDFKKTKLQTSETVGESDRNCVNGNDDKVEKNSDYKKGRVKKRKVGKNRKRQSAFQDHHEIENNILNSEDESPMKRKKRSAKPVFAKLPSNAQNIMDQNEATVKSEDNLNLPECTIDQSPLDVEHDKTSVLVAWKDSEVDTQVMESTGLLDPADLSQLVKSAKMAWNKHQGD